MTLHEQALLLAHLDVEHEPYILQPRLRQILEQIRKPGHGLVGLLQRPELAYKIVVAVDELLVTPKTAL